MPTCVMHADSDVARPTIATLMSLPDDPMSLTAHAAAADMAAADVAAADIVASDVAAASVNPKPPPGNAPSPAGLCCSNDVPCLLPG